ncbi:MAG: hypothetical protein CMN55_12875 [Sneathiella sp.]|uniref:TFIIB-type zinc ribbon-containing protein n=1 Tax=Sneathiella sp. TaxID=1964365 RepID=UPI000C5EA24A|nr:zf-TFIIB domain-containing protein [Sneathiella sp.]MAL79986.1 hypothetical protein [Sneathiella sp.]
MQCPVCEDVNMTMADRQGVEIDYCPKCRGVWLDRGELDKIIDRTNAAAPEPERGYDTRQRDSQHRSHGSHDDRGYGHKRKKKSSLLSELFDF